MTLLDGTVALVDLEWQSMPFIVLAVVLVCTFIFIMMWIRDRKLKLLEEESK